MKPNDNQLCIKKLKRQFLYSIISGILSFLLILITYLKPPDDRHNAAHMFAYNFGFFFPMIFFSVVTGALSFIYLLRSKNAYNFKGLIFILLIIILPTFLLFPMTINLLFIFFQIIHILII
jgi:uncharacterized membrane protein HdeD (DUF308 family)